MAETETQTTGTALVPSRMPLAPSIAREFDVTAANWRVLVETIWPAAKTPEAVMMALSYCRARNLDPFKKPVHIVPMWSSALGRMVETVWPGISELRTTASRTKHYAGIDPPEWGPMVKRTFNGVVEKWENRVKVPREETVTVEFPEWCRRTIYRLVDGHRVGFTAEVYWTEAYATLGKDSELPNDMWRSRPRGQLDKVTEAAALRMAFPEEAGGDLTAEEMEGKVLIDATANVADPAGLFAEPKKLAAPAKPAGGPPSAPKLPVANLTDEERENVMRSTGVTQDDERMEERERVAKDNPIPAKRPGAQRQGQPEIIDPDKLMADATTRFSAVDDGDASGWFDVWKDFVGYEAKLLPIDWVDLTDLAQRHYDRTHDDGGKVLDNGQVGN